MGPAPISALVASLFLPSIVLAEPAAPGGGATTPAEARRPPQADLQSLKDENAELRGRLERIETALAERPARTSPPSLPSTIAEAKATLQPTILGEIDYRVYPSEIEGYSGFALARVRPGLVLAPLPWIRAVGTFEFAGEYPVVLDAFLRLRAAEWLELTVGYSRPPLFASFTHEPEHVMPFPDRAPVVRGFRVQRDAGADVHWVPRDTPLEAWLRIGNGTGSPLGNDNALPAGYGSLDLVLGRAWVGAAAESRFFGLRIGGGAFVENARDRNGITGQTPLGFVYYRPVVVSGRRVVGEGHVVAYAGPLRLTVEGAVADESRSRDEDGNPATPRVELPRTQSHGIDAELTWVLHGLPREVGRAPESPRSQEDAWAGGVVELAARYDGMWLGRGADDVRPGGSQGGALAAKWWPLAFLATSLAGYLTRYDVGAIEAPGQLWSWGAVARASFFWGAGQERMSFATREQQR